VRKDDSIAQHPLGFPTLWDTGAFQPYKELGASLRQFVPHICWPEAACKKEMVTRAEASLDSHPSSGLPVARAVVWGCHPDPSAAGEEGLASPELASR